MGVKLIELRPDRNLIKSNFDGYKLSLEPVPVNQVNPRRKNGHSNKFLLQVLRDDHKSHQLPNRDLPNLETQYSFLHQELFGHQNLLTADPWNQKSAYYVTLANSIENVRFDGKISRSRRCFQLPSSRRMRSPGDYNYNLQFINQDYLVVSNGMGGLFLIATGDRKSTNATWKLVHEETILKNDGFVIKDARLEEQGDRKVINVLVLQIIPETDCSEKFMTKLIWIGLKENGDANWERVSRRELVAKKTIVPFAAFTEGGTGLIIASQNTFKFLLDTEKEVQTEKTGPQEQLANPKFTWTQTAEDVVVNFAALEEDSRKSDFYVKCTKEAMTVKFKDLILLDSELCFKIDPELTTWQLANDSLQITMVKGVEGEAWEQLIPGGPTESTDSDATTTPIVAESFSSVPHLTAGLEDCDRDDGEFFIEQVDAVTHSITHRIYLGSSAPLFSKNLTTGKAIALRQDVDTCVWGFEGDSEHWRHLGTLDAFGYVAASKQQRKFLECSPDMNYSVICEAERHVFIYKSEYAGTAGGLRNRSGNQIKFGQQNLVTLEETGEVIGMVVQDEITFLLTPKCVLCLKINEDSE